jgi:hypothetical protein
LLEAIAHSLFRMASSHSIMFCCLRVLKSAARSGFLEYLRPGQDQHIPVPNLPGLGAVGAGLKQDLGGLHRSIIIVSLEVKAPANGVIIVEIKAICVHAFAWVSGSGPVLCYSNSSDTVLDDDVFVILAISSLHGVGPLRRCLLNLRVARKETCGTQASRRAQYQRSNTAQKGGGPNLYDAAIHGPLWSGQSRRRNDNDGRRTAGAAAAQFWSHSRSGPPFDSFAGTNFWG